MMRFSYDLRLPNHIFFLHHAQTVEDFICFRELDYYSEALEAFNLRCVCDNGNQDVDRPSGFLTKKMLKELVPNFVEYEIYCCGPQPYMDNVRKILEHCHFDMDFYHTESFNFADSTAALAENVTEYLATVDDDVSTAEISYSIKLAKMGKVIDCNSSTTILAALKQANIPVPFACSKGRCGTCRTLKIAGEVDMLHEGGILTKHEEQGFILVCCAKPLSDVELDI